MIRTIQIVAFVGMIFPIAGQALALQELQERPDTSAVVDSSSQSTNPAGQPFLMGEESKPALGSTGEVARTIHSQSFIESPTGTLLKSVAFPGWGQWSNGKRQKAAVYFGIESYWITKALIWRDRARKADNYPDFSHARDRRNYFYWLTGITVFVSMFDAYADRYLLTLERTRNMPDEFWGEQCPSDLGEHWRLTLAIKF